MLCVLKENNLIEEFLQGIDYRKVIKGNEIKEAVANIRQEMLSTLKKELRLCKKDISKEKEINNKLLSFPKEDSNYTAS